MVVIVHFHCIGLGQGMRDGQSQNPISDMSRFKLAFENESLFGVDFRMDGLSKKKKKVMKRIWSFRVRIYSFIVCVPPHHNKNIHNLCVI